MSEPLQRVVAAAEPSPRCSRLRSVVEQNERFRMLRAEAKHQLAPDNWQGSIHQARRRSFAEQCVRAGPRAGPERNSSIEFANTDCDEPSGKQSESTQPELSRPSSIEEESSMRASLEEESRMRTRTIRRADADADADEENALPRALQVCSCTTRHLHKYGAPPAVSVYLRSQVELGWLMFLCFLIALPETWDNVSRNWTRNECRNLLSTPTGYARLTALANNGTDHSQFATLTANQSTAVDSSDSAIDTQFLRCGFSGAAPRSQIEALPAFLLPARGTCFEYRQGTQSVQPVRGPDAFVRLRAHSELCDTDGWASRWIRAIYACMLVGFLLRLRAIQSSIATCGRAGQLSPDFSSISNGCNSTHPLPVLTPFVSLPSSAARTTTRRTRRETTAR